MAHKVLVGAKAQPGGQRDTRVRAEAGSDAGKSPAAAGWPDDERHAPHDTRSQLFTWLPERGSSSELTTGQALLALLAMVAFLAIVIGGIALTMH
jgi:hypothetical protein